jgi:hypothetical protein
MMGGPSAREMKGLRHCDCRAGSRDGWTPRAGLGAAQWLRLQRHSAVKEGLSAFDCKYVDPADVLLGK